MTRKYDMKRRAKRQEETRQRIVEATVELHKTVGMARTTISAIAEKAGVERLTVYRHFPDERALFSACSGHWNAANPPPDPASWTQVADPEERLRSALSEVYAYHRRVLLPLNARQGSAYQRRGGRSALHKFRISSLSKPVGESRRADSNR